jgi:hypothetical protein
MVDSFLTLLAVTGWQQNVDPKQLESIITLGEKFHPAIRDLLDSVEMRLAEILECAR